MFFRLTNRLQFLIKSTNQHGIHSPFVFDLTTKGLYKKDFDINILKENVENLYLSSKEKIILTKVFNYFKNDNNSNLTPEFFSSINDVNKELETYSGANKFLIIKGPNKSKDDVSKWKKLIQHPSATVTIDLYYFGLVFFRQEQEKEHFIIRV